MDGALCTDTLQTVKTYFWIGDAFRILSTYAAKASNYEIGFLIPLSNVICGLYAPGTVARAIRRSTLRERRKSRLYSHWMHESMHVMILVEDIDGCKTQLLFSSNLKKPQYVEVIDVDNVEWIRFCTWLFHQIDNSYDFNGTLAHTMTCCIIPLLKLKTPTKTKVTCNRFEFDTIT